MTQNSRGRSFVPTRVAGRAVAAGLSAGLIASAVAFAGPALAADASGNVITNRVSGATRFETANALSAAEWGTVADGKTVPTSVVIARGDVGVDALSASALAGAKNGPVLLVNSKSIPTSVVVELARLKAANASLAVYIVGGTGAISSDVETTINSITGATAVRYAGADRYETAAKVAAAVGATPGTVILARGDLLADALSAGPEAFASKFPVLLTKPTALPDSTKAYLATLPTSTKVYIMGGTGAVSGDVETSVKAILTGTTVSRFAGADRYETARLFAEQENTDGFGTDNIVLARGDADNFADALAAGPYAGKNNAQILLVSGINSIPAATVKFHTDHATYVDATHGIASITVSGGAGVFSDAALGAAAKAAGDTFAPAFASVTGGAQAPVQAVGSLGSNLSYITLKAASGATTDGVLGNGVTVNVVKGTTDTSAGAGGTATVSTDGRTITVSVSVDTNTDSATYGQVNAKTSQVEALIDGAKFNGVQLVDAAAVSGDTIATTGSSTLSGGVTEYSYVGTFNDSEISAVGMGNFGLDLDQNTLGLEVPAATKVTQDTTNPLKYTVVFDLTAAQVKTLDGATPGLYVSGVSDLAGNTKAAFAVTYAAAV